MTNELDSTTIRELSADELVAVSGGRQYCNYEAAGRCYQWRDETWIEAMFSYLNGVAVAAGHPPPFTVPAYPQTGG
jgi:hypothetical protein